MERESFEDEEVAGILRENFVSVKVDKEERPDIDAVYMQVTQMLTGSGGWPMTVLLTPDKAPLFAGTYFPKTTRYGRIGLTEILKSAAMQWRTDKARLISIGDKLSAGLFIGEGKIGTAKPSKAALASAFEWFRETFDNVNGGFGTAPKFPSPHNLMFLLRHSYYENEPQAAAMTEKTLTQMYRGGIFDHIGGGFSRYSTDPRWLVPHFEKMLYDNALLTEAYLEAYTHTKNEVFRIAALKTIAYVQREMTDSDGGFYSAQDADSDGHEGLYYVWTPEEASALLGKSDAEYWCGCYGVTKSGNFEGKSIPNLLNNADFHSINAKADELNKKLYNHRLMRVKLHKDDKTLTGWNAMMISALAQAYSILGQKEHLDCALRALTFIRDKLTDVTGRLRVSYRDGEARGSGYLDDYAYYTRALLSLYGAAYDPMHLESAVFYAEMMCRLFEDTENGGFYMYSDDAEQLIARPKETYDGAVPSGNSVASFVLCRLSHITGDRLWQERADRQLTFLADCSESHPSAYCYGAIAQQSALYPQRKLICVLPSHAEIEALRKTLAEHFTPDLSVIAITPDNRKKLETLIPELTEYPKDVSMPTFYLCRGVTCTAPFTGFSELASRLQWDASSFS